MHLDKLNRSISGRPGFDSFEESYSSTAPWPRRYVGIAERWGVPQIKAAIKINERRINFFDKREILFKKIIIN